MGGASGATVRAKVGVNKPPAEFVVALRSWRKRVRRTQEHIAKALGISRKTYVLFESGRWRVPAREQSHFADMLRELDPNTGALFARAHGIVYEEREPETSPSLVAPTVAAVPPSAYARAVVDASLYSVAEKLDVAPRTVRAIASALFARLQAADISITQAAEMVAAADAEMKREA
jgi:DNA-binding XRE family transcriptional regulator